MRSSSLVGALLCLAAVAFAAPAAAGAQEAEQAEDEEPEQVAPAPDRGPDEGGGPYERLIIRGATLIDGTGGMPRGPVDIVIEGSTIEEIASVGAPKTDIDPGDRPQDATREIDASGMYVLPGLIDNHVHTGGIPKAPEAEYVYKLWMGHGVTTARGVSFGPMEWSLSERERSASNEIVAPRMVVFQRPGSGEGWDREIRTPENAREWVRYADEQGVDGLKLGAHWPPIMEALIDEANRLGMGTTAHLSQTGVANMNAMDAARLGMTGFTHFYGLFEAMYEDHDVQPWPPDANYSDEQDRFARVARQWEYVEGPGSEKWEALLEEFMERDYFVNPTMVIYEAGRDVSASRQAVWHDEYTLPSLYEYYRASRTDHGSYWYYWTTHDETAWRNFYDLWMEFLDDYKDMGGRVTVGSDAGFIYKTYGFSTIEEMELLQEAGFTPLEAIRAATMHGAQEIWEPKDEPIPYGVVREGKLADLAIVPENPLENLKVLYGTGAVKLNDETGEVERVGGVRWTIKDGIVYDARELLADVREMVDEKEAGTAGVGEEGGQEGGSAPVVDPGSDEHGGGGP